MFRSKTIRAAILATGLCAAGHLLYSVRAFLPTPPDNLARLHMLEGWSSKGYYAFNCSGVLTNAHGEDWISEKAFYAGRANSIRIVASLPSRYAINEAALQPGDIAAFAGPSGTGQHVAAYLGSGMWIDGDNRRGNVARYRLATRPAGDTWFTGDVHIIRWNGPARSRGLGYTAHFFAAEQAGILAE